MFTIVGLSEKRAEWLVYFFARKVNMLAVTDQHCIVCVGFNGAECFFNASIHILTEHKLAGMRYTWITFVIISELAFFVASPKPCLSVIRQCNTMTIAACHIDYEHHFPNIYPFRSALKITVSFCRVAKLAEIVLPPREYRTGICTLNIVSNLLTTKLCVLLQATLVTQTRSIFIN